MSRKKVNEILWRLAKERRITNDKVIKLLDWYSKKYLLKRDEVQHLCSDDITKDRRARRRADNLIGTAWKRCRYHRQAKSPSRIWRRKTTTRKITMKRRRCELCGRVRKLEQHHIFPIVMGGKHVAKNIMIVCRNCHHLVHVKKGYVELAKAGGLSEKAVEKLEFFKKTGYTMLTKYIGLSEKELEKFRSLRRKGYIILAKADGLSGEALEKLKFLRKMAQGRVSKSVATKYNLLTGIKIRISRKPKK